MKKLSRIFIWLIVGIFVLLGLVFLFVQSPTGQDFITIQAASFLRKKLGTPVTIQKVRFRIPDWVLLEGVFVPDLKKDTLLAGKRLYIDIDMLGLLTNNVKLNQIELEDIRLKVNRTLPDTTFNFNYILDAFMSKEPDTTSSNNPFDISLKRVKLNNVKITYKDAVIGTDADLYVKDLETEFGEFNLAKSQFHFNQLIGDGGSAKLRLYKPLKTSVSSAEAPADKNTADTLDLKVGKVDLANFKWLLESEEDGLRNGVNLGRLQAQGDKIYLNSQKIIFKKIALQNTTAFVEMAKMPKQGAKSKAADSTSSGSPGWEAIIGDIQLSKVGLRYDDNNSVRITRGLDYSHLDVKDLGLLLKNFIYSTDRIAGQVSKGTFTEQSGLVLQNLSTNFNYSNKEIGLRNFLLKTPHTVIRDEVVMQYDTIADLTNNLGNVRVKASIKQSQLAIKDLLILMPDLAKTPTFKGNQNDIIKADGLITGRVNNLAISKLAITGFGATRVMAKGNITGLPDANKLGFNLSIDEVSTTRKDIVKLAGPGVLPESIEIPEKLTLRGKLKGKADDLQVDASLNSDFGVAVITGKLQNFMKGRNQAYNAKLTLQDFDAGRLIKQPETVGKLTLELNAQGTGIDPKTMNANFSGTAQSAVLKGYEYNNIVLRGDIHNQIANIQTSLDDPNADFRLVSRIDLSKPYPGVHGEININNIDLKKLNLYAEDLKLKGDIKVDMASTDPKNPVGTVHINQTVIETGGKIIPLDTTSLAIKELPEGHDILVKSPILNAHINGDFDYIRLLDILLTEISKYFIMPNLAYTPVTEPYKVKIDLKVNQHPLIQSFVPALTKLDTVRLAANLDNRKDTTLQVSLAVPLVEYDSSIVRNAGMKIFAVGNKATYNGAIGLINVADFAIRRTTLGGEIAENALTARVVLKDSLKKDRFVIPARLQSIDNKYRLNLSTRGTLIDYKEWRSDSLGYLEYGQQGILAKQFLLEQNGQRLLVNSTSDEPNSPIAVDIDSLDIKPFVTLATLDSTMAGGTLNGDFKISNYMAGGTPGFTGDLVIRNFTFSQKPIGNLTLNASNETADRIAAKAAITSDKNDIQLNGNYLLNEKNTLDFNVDINKLSAETIQAFSFGQLKNSSGNLSGKLSLIGEPTKPLLNGQLKFDDVALTPTQLGSKYVIKSQALVFDNSDIKFNNFVIADTLGQKLQINGNLNMQNLPSFAYNLNVKADNFMVLNGNRKDNDFFYGKGFVDANLNVRGVGAKPSIDGSVKLKEGSDITVILPDQSIGETETEGIVEFVNMKSPAVDKPVDSTIVETNYDFASEMALNIEVDDKSQLNIVIDEVNGDNLKIKGNAQLNTGITPSGEFYIFGLYELVSGQYDLTFQVLKRQFTIEKGSTLLWTGDPMKAQIDITAAYPIDVELTSLSDDAKAFGKVPVKVLLKMQGSLSSPDISFDIVLDGKATGDQKNFVENNALFSTFRDDPVAMNKQVFSLLILNRFSGEQSSDFFSGINAEAMARQSVSKILTDQLNVLAGDLIKGVKLDFNLNSDILTGQTGSVLGNRTDLNVGLSKAFLNDRLTVSVGRNFQLENTTGIQKSSTEIFDNIALNYALSKDGQYMFRAFRKNEFFILDGYVQETGVSFLVTLSYERLKELLSKKK